MSISLPARNEYAEWMQKYVDFTQAAMQSAGESDLVAFMGKQVGMFRALLKDIPVAAEEYSYGPGKWTLAESLVHTSDTERVFAFRLVHIARGDKRPLMGFSQDEWMPECRVSGRRTLGDILDEMDAVRGASLSLIRSLDETALSQIGTASDKPVSSRALVWLIAGHMHHHLVLARDSYLAGYSASK